MRGSDTNRLVNFWQRLAVRVLTKPRTIKAPSRPAPTRRRRRTNTTTTSTTIKQAFRNRRLTTLRGGVRDRFADPLMSREALLLSPLFAFRVYTWNPRILQQAIATRCGSTKEVQGRKTESSNDRGTAIESKCQRIESVHLYIYKLLFTRFDSLTFRLNGRSSDRPVSGCWYSRFLIDRL